MKNHKGIKIHRRTNKDRSTGRRGGKKRYTLWKAEDNLKWEKCHERTLYWCCAKWDLDPETFIVRDDPTRDLWSNAMSRLGKYLKDNNYFAHTDRGCRRLQVERIKAFEKKEKETKE